MSYNKVTEAIIEFLEQKEATAVERAVNGNSIVDHLVGEIDSGKLDISLKRDLHPSIIRI